MIADAESQAHAATKAVVEQVQEDAETRTALLRILEAITMLRESGLPARDHRGRPRAPGLRIPPRVGLRD